MEKKHNKNRAPSNKQRMNRIIIICEGQTEQEFCRNILYPYFINKDIEIEYPTIKKSGGGIVKWTELKKQIENHLKENAYVTTFVDFYGITTKHAFPKWKESEAIVDKDKKMAFIENEMRNDIDEKIRYKFIPYIQLHEFESLLFIDYDTFVTNVPSDDFIGKTELKETLNNFKNPEMINNSKETSPSHRLERIIRGYEKITYGIYLADEIGLGNIRNKCPRFNSWIEKIENI